MLQSGKDFNLFWWEISTEVNLDVLSTNTSEILLFLKERNKVRTTDCSKGAFLSKYELPLRYSFSDKQVFSEFSQGASIFAKPKLLAEFKIGLYEIDLAQGFLLIHKCSLWKRCRTRSLPVLHRFPSTKIPLPGLVWIRRGITVRRSDLVNLWICSQAFRKISNFLCEYNPSSVIVFKSLFLSCDVKLGGNEVITLRYKQIGQNRR